MSRPPGPNGIRSPNYGAIVGKRLTDRQIDKYILAGRYGEARRAALQAQKDAEKKKKRPTSSWAKVKKLLDL